MSTSLSDLIGRQGGPRLAVEFRADEVALFSLSEDGEWRERTSVRVDAPDLNDRAADMRRIAAKLRGAARPQADIWLPAEQIANLEIEQGEKPKHAALAKLTEDGTLTAQELIVDTTPYEGGYAVSAAEKIVVKEARDYIARWGFAPQRVTTRHGHIAFSAGPTFAREERRVAASAPALVVIAALSLIAVGLGWAMLGEGDAPVETAVVESATAEVEPPSEEAEVALAPELETEAPELQAATPPEETALPDTTDDAAQALIDAPEPKVAPAPALAPALGAEGAALSEVVLSDPLDAGPTIRFSDITASVAADPGTKPIAPGAAEPIALRVLTPAELGEAFALAPYAPDIAETEPAAVLANFDATAESPAVSVAPGILGDDLTPPEADPEAVAEEVVETEEPAPSADDATSEASALPNPAPTPERRALSVTSDPRAPTREEATEDPYAPGPGSVIASPEPRARPDGLDMTPSSLAVARAPTPGARPKSIKPRPQAVASGQARTVSRPQRSGPAGPGVANAATLAGAIELTQMNLLGVFGQQGSRRALLRLPNGDVMRVSRGTVVEGWVVSRIDKTSMRITRGGEAQTLNVVQ